MKTGRSDPCPCGSGKKYKLCCLGSPGDRESRGSAQVIADKVAEAAVEQPFESLEEINAFTAQLANERNQWALAEFCGLSPEQMTHVLYNPFDSPQTIQFSTDIERQVGMESCGLQPGNDHKRSASRPPQSLISSSPVVVARCSISSGAAPGY